MPDRLDEAIRTMIWELVEASPPPPPAKSVVDRAVHHRTSWAWWLPLRPAVVAALVLVVGAGGVLLGRHVFPASPPAREQVRVVAGDRAAEPEFPTAAMGTEVLLLPASGTVAPGVGPDLVGDVVAVGRVAESDIEVFTWRIGSEGVEGECVEVVGPRARESACSASAVAPELHPPSTFSYRAPNEPDRTVVTWRVPEGTSVAALEVEGLRMWQRPVGGVAVFIVDRPAFGLAFISGWRADGAEFGRIGFSDRELPPPHGAFSEPTGAVLVFDDGLSGVVALDLDSGRVERRVLDGQRPGDPEYRLTRVGDHLVVGWGTISALAIDTLAGTSVGEATVFIPAVEPDAVWLIDFQGARIGGGRPTYRLVSLDGTESVSATGLADPAVGYPPAHGVPGGVVHEADFGITIWYPDAETVRIPGSGPGFVADVSGGLIAWCEGECTLHLTEIAGGDRLVSSPEPGRSFEPRSARFSPDGRLLAAIIGDPGPIGLDSTGAIAVIDVASGEATVVTEPLLPRPSYIGWSPDGQNLFFSSYSYGQSEVLIGWYRPADGHLEVVTLPFGGTMSFVVLDSEEADAFFPAG